MSDFHIKVEFGKGIPPDIQARALFHLEEWMRGFNWNVEVFKATMPDDSKLRLKMTDEERAKL